MFTEVAFPDRFAAAAEAGFPAVECQFPYAWPADELATRRREAGLPLVLLNGPPGDAAAGERGLAGLPGREADLRSSIETALRYAETLEVPTVHVMAGIGGHEACYIDNLGWAADRLASAGITATIEPLNGRDMPGYLLTGSAQAERIIAAVGRPNLKLQFDTYHLQILEGDLLTSFRRCLPVVGHVQIASVPDRHEPDEGEVDHRWLLERFTEAGYDGWVGAEYNPRAGTAAGLGWLGDWGLR